MKPSSASVRSRVDWTERPAASNRAQSSRVMMWWRCDTGVSFAGTGRPRPRGRSPKPSTSSAMISATGSTPSMRPETWPAMGMAASMSPPK